jgi:poly(beta-D-mannuronate) lyase
MQLPAFLIAGVLFATMTLARQPAAAAPAKLPSKVLDLSLWKLTLPAAGAGSKHAREVAQPELAAFAEPTFFHTSDDGAGVVFRAPAAGATTKGSRYPRSELREMKDATKPASWSTDDGLIHRMEVTVAVLQLPEKKPEVVCAQIHDAEDDLLMVRLEGRRLLVERNRTGDVLLLDGYKLGECLRLKIEAGGGAVRVWCNDRLAMTWDTQARGCYFKAGCYTQSNPSKGDRGESAGAVMISELHVSHSER